MAVLAQTPLPNACPRASGSRPTLRPRLLGWVSLALAALVAASPLGGAVAPASSASAEMRQVYADLVALAEQRGVLTPSTAASALLLAEPGSVSSAAFEAILGRMGAEIAAAPQPSEEDRAAIEAAGLRFSELAAPASVEAIGSAAASPCLEQCEAEYHHCISNCILRYIACMFIALFLGPWAELLCLAAYYHCAYGCALDYVACAGYCTSEPPDHSFAEVREVVSGPAQELVEASPSGPPVLERLLGSSTAPLGSAT